MNAEIFADLCAPFPPEVVELKPGAVAKEKQRALALAYVDARHYQARLDSVVGPQNWHVAYRPWGERGVFCSLRIYDVTREDVGEADKDDPNQATSAAMQAFKRVCASYGLGRYLYTDLPQMWVEAEERGRAWVIKNQQAAVRDMYVSAGIKSDKCGKYIQRIRTLLNDMNEEELAMVGKHIASMQKTPTN